MTESVRPDARAVRRWTGAWVGGAVLGIVNGSLREFTYGRRLNEHAAHQVSTGTLILMLMLYMRGLEQRWPIGSRRAALRIGGTWAFLTVLFEFGFGHFIGGKSWRRLLEDYDLTKGRLWSLVLISMAAGPAYHQRGGRISRRGGQIGLPREFHPPRGAEGPDA